MFSELKITNELTENYSDEAFINAEEQLMQKFGENARRPAGDYVDLVTKLLDKENNLGAISVLKRAAEVYPNYIGLLNFLAQLYEKSGQNKKAIEAYVLGVEVSKKYKLGQEEGFLKEIERLKKTN